MALTAETLARRAAWLPHVEVATQAHRERRAEELIRKGTRHVWWDAEELLEDTGLLETLLAQPGAVYCPAVPLVGCESRQMPVSVWHHQRATAQLERFERLSDCGTESRVTSCDCGDRPDTRIDLWCDHWRLCLACKGRRCKRYRARFERGRQAMLQRFAWETNKRANAWTEKMLTVTVPHSGSVVQDVCALIEAWPRFRGRVGRFLAKRGVAKWREVPYWRSLEVTRSDQGHAHFHAWLLSPFLPQRLIAHYWGASLPEGYRSRLPTVRLLDVLRDSPARDHEALRKAAFVDAPFRLAVRESDARARAAKARWRSKPDDSFRLLRKNQARERAELLRDDCSLLYAPVLDIRKADAGTAAELVKYIVKDFLADDAGNLSPLDAEEYAGIYAALTGVRVLSTSPHWMVDALDDEGREWCPCCGSYLSVTFVAAGSRRATGPPH